MHAIQKFLNKLYHSNYILADPICVNS